MAELINQDKEQQTQKEGLLAEQREAGANQLRLKKEEAELHIKNLKDDLAEIDEKIHLIVEQKLDKAINRIVEVCKTNDKISFTKLDVEKFYEEAKQKIKLKSGPDEAERKQYIHDGVSYVKEKILEPYQKKLDRLTRASMESEERIKKLQEEVKTRQEELDSYNRSVEAAKSRKLVEV